MTRTPRGCATLENKDQSSLSATGQAYREVLEHCHPLPMKFQLAIDPKSLGILTLPQGGINAIAAPIISHSFPHDYPVTI